MCVYNIIQRFYHLSFYPIASNKLNFTDRENCRHLYFPVIQLLQLTCGATQGFSAIENLLSRFIQFVLLPSGFGLGLQDIIISRHIIRLKSFLTGFMFHLS
jgi:hypothetical protein